MSKKRKKQKKNSHRICTTNLLHEEVTLKAGEHEGKRGVVLEFDPDKNQAQPYLIKVRGANQWIDGKAFGVYVHAAIDEFTVI